MNAPRIGCRAPARHTTPENRDSEMPGRLGDLAEPGALDGAGPAEGGFPHDEKA